MAKRFDPDRNGRGVASDCGKKIWKDYQQFRRELPVIAEEAQLDPGQLTFLDYLQLVINWLKEHR